MQALKPQRNSAWAVVWALVAAGLTQFGMELAAGNVPLPQEVRWLVPILVAVISALSPYVLSRRGETP